jgi:hypothetical protein
LSFSLSSPPNQAQKSSILSPTPERIGDFLSSHFSPSIFSPDEMQGKFPLRDTEKQGEQSHSSFPLFDDPLSPDFMLQDNKEHLLELKYKNPARNSNSNGQYVEPPPKPWPVKTARMLNNSDEDTGDEELLSSSDPHNVLKVPSNDESSASRKQKRNDKKVNSTKSFNKKAGKLSSIPTVFTPESSSIPPIISPDQQEFSRKLTMDSAASSSSVDKNSLSPKSSTISLKKAVIMRANNETSTPTTSGKTTCNCKKSRCLKLYCDCFAVLNYCNPSCNCVQCNNVLEHEDKRSQAVRQTKERNPLAFQTKISDKEVHVSGCHCKNSHCLKKYCECFTGGALCSNNCKCQSCKNFSGSVDLAKTRESSPQVNGNGSSLGSNLKKRKESPNSVAWLDAASPDANFRDNSLAGKSFGKDSTSAGSSAAPTKTHEYLLRANTKENSVVKSALVSSSFEGIDKDVQQRGFIETHQNGHTNKKKRVNFPPIHITYPFFGPHNPPFPKIVALKCLDFLPDKDICMMSMVNTLWYDAANDEALWE